MTIVVDFANNSKIDRDGEFLKVGEYYNPKDSLNSGSKAKPIQQRPKTRQE